MDQSESFTVCFGFRTSRSWLSFPVLVLVLVEDKLRERESVSFLWRSAPPGEEAVMQDSFSQAGLPHTVRKRRRFRQSFLAVSLYLQHSFSSDL